MNNNLFVAGYLPTPRSMMSPIGAELSLEVSSFAFLCFRAHQISWKINFCIYQLFQTFLQLSVLMQRSIECFKNWKTYRLLRPSLSVSEWITSSTAILLRFTLLPNILRKYTRWTFLRCVPIYIFSSFILCSRCWLMSIPWRCHFCGKCSWFRFLRIWQLLCRRLPPVRDCASF